MDGWIRSREINGERKLYCARQAQEAEQASSYSMEISVKEDGDDVAQAIDEEEIRIVEIEIGETKSTPAQIIDEEAPCNNELLLSVASRWIK